MLKGITLTLAALTLAALAGAPRADAQTQRIGLGIAANFDSSDSGVSILGGTRVYVLVPIQLAGTLRVEPMVGINTVDSDGIDASDVTLGAGVLFALSATQQAQLYAGGRLALDLVSWDDGVSDESGVDFRIAGAIGGEYFLAPRFSLGAEADFGYYATSDGNYAIPDASGFYTAGYLVSRFYF
jgi:hypothetical protein